MLTTLTSRGGLTATTAIAACGLLILTEPGQTLLRPIFEPITTTESDLTPEDRAAVRTPPGAARLEETGGIAEIDRVQPEPAPRTTAADSGAATGMAADGAPVPRAPLRARQIPGDGAGIVASGQAARPESAARPGLGADTEAFPDATPNGLEITAESPVSTFSIDVDTASYAIVRQSLNSGAWPPAGAVRIEEMINYFPYDLAAPAAGEAPFRPSLSVFETPWNPGTRLVHIAIQGTLPPIEARPPLNLVFLIDTSGSMDDPAKLPLLKQGLRLMLDQLRPEDEVAIVEYAGSAGLVLPATAAADREDILAALNGLGAGGRTNGQGGLEQAYAVADGMAADGEVSRVLLATDGDFNVGLSGTDALTDFIARKRETGTYLSVLGFGRGNLDDATMQALAQNGNGIAAYIDTLGEAQKVLVDQLTGALFTIAEDVKVQVEFNPALIAEYRLVGYETRALAREDFNNDSVDAGELGAGHSVTALFEVTPAGSDARLTDPLRYGVPDVAAGPGDEIGFLRLRWKAPGESDSRLIEAPIPAAVPEPGQEARFATAIAAFGQLLQGSDWLGSWGWDEAIALAAASRGDDAFGYRSEAVRLMRIAKSLSGQ